MNGVLYSVWGKGIEKDLERSIASLNATNPGIPYHVIGYPDDADLRWKSKSHNETLFDITISLDADTVVLWSLDDVFRYAEEYGMAACINENPWAIRGQGNHTNRYGDSLIEYNTGVLAWNKNNVEAVKVLNKWEELAFRMDASILWRAGVTTMIQEMNDQPSFARACCDLGYQPFILPHVYNFRPMWHDQFFGKIIIWHDHRDPPEYLSNYLERVKNDQLWHAIDVRAK